MYDLAIAHIDRYMARIVAGSIEQKVSRLNAGNIDYGRTLVSIILDVGGGRPDHLVVGYTQQPNAECRKYGLYKSGTVRAVREACSTIYIWIADILECEVYDLRAGRCAVNLQIFLCGNNTVLIDRILLRADDYRRRNRHISFRIEVI